MHWLAHSCLAALLTTTAPSATGLLPHLAPTGPSDTIGWTPLAERLGLDPGTARRPEEACSSSARAGLRCLAADTLMGMALGILHDLGCRVVVLSQWYYYEVGDADYGSVDASAEMRACRHRSDCVWEALERYTAADPDNLHDDYQITASFSAGGTLRVFGRQAVNGAFGRIQGTAIPGWQERDTYAKRHILAAYVLAPSDQSPRDLADRIETFMDRLKLDGSYQAPRLRPIECRTPPAPPQEAAVPPSALTTHSTTVPVSGRDSVPADTAAAPIVAVGAPADTAAQAVPDTVPTHTTSTGESVVLPPPAPGTSLSAAPVERLRVHAVGARAGAALYFAGETVGAVATVLTLATVGEPSVLVPAVALAATGNVLRYVGAPVACGNVSGVFETLQTAGVPSSARTKDLCWGCYKAGWVLAAASSIFSAIGTASHSTGLAVLSSALGLGQDVIWTVACVNAMVYAGRAQRAAVPPPVSVGLSAGPDGRVGAGLRWAF